MPYIIFIAAPSAEALMVMYEEGRRKGVGRGVSEIYRSYCFKEYFREKIDEKIFQTVQII